ncbi:MAG: hypothetical protein Q9165_000952 [Trypethelium subeluteriae]
MLVPRAFSYASIQKQHVEVYEEKPKRPSLAKVDALTPKPKSSGPGPVPSKPVGIPQRSSEAPQDAVRTRGNTAQHDSPSTPRPGHGHDPAKMSPSVAALLAMTTIPPPKRHQIGRKRKNATPRRVSIDELMQDWHSDEPTPSPSVGGDSPLSILLEPPEEQDTAGSTILCNNREEQDLPTSRSISSDSTPSLGTDEASVFSSSLPTPDGNRGPRSFERKAKSFSSPRSESCKLDHPLSRPLRLEDEENDSPSHSPAISILSASAQTSPPSLTATFKSNLTASLLALKSAAKSFSNFTAPSFPSDDLLTRSIIYPRFTPEMRPKPVHGVPEPAFRRYLNPNLAQQPSTWQRSPPPPNSAPSFHESAILYYDAERHPHDLLDAAAPMIQLQTYENGRPTRTRRVESKGGSPRGATPDASSEAGRTLAGAGPCSTDSEGATTLVRQREPRENSDFLRMVVLEMNMRRVGKLDAKKGRARMWLPPRQAMAVKSGSGSTKTDAVAVDHGRCGGSLGSSGKQGVPARWVSVVA